MASQDHPETNPDATESTPLLATAQEDGRDAHISGVSILALVCALLMLIDIAGFLGMAPQMQIFEDIICHNYYATGNRPSLPDDERCKIEPVQSQLAIIQGYKETFDQLPGIVFGVVYGLLADRVGRRPILLCGMLGLALSGLWVKIVCWFPESIPFKLVYLSAPILVFGGGAQVASSMFYVMLADSYPDEERYVP
jgi:MFS family permease